MDVDNNDGNKKNILAFALIIIIALAIVGFNWFKNLKYTLIKEKTPKQIETENELRKNFEDLKNILNDGAEKIKNMGKNIVGYGTTYGYGETNINSTTTTYGYGEVNYDELLKNIKPEDIEQYIQDNKEIDNTLNNL